LLQRTPILAAWWLVGRRGVPTSAWLPTAWVLGELLQGAVSQMTYTDWIYSQWQWEPMLRLVGLVGGLAASWLALTLASLAADAVAMRSWPVGAATLAAAGGLALAPPLPSAVPPIVAKVGVVHMASYLHPPRAVPPGVELVIWPEEASGRRPWLVEGPGNGQRVEPPIQAPHVDHLYGVLTRSPEGLKNSLVAVAGSGQVWSSRAKIRGFPFFERPVLGIGGHGFAPGRAAPTMAVGAHRVVGLLCCEALDRDLARAGGGAELIAIAASDQVLVHSPLAHRQFLAITVMRAVENHLPAVRASLYGGACIVAPNGRVLAVARDAGDGILT
jgi:apolipoprotein N-acyltransferase